MGEVLIGIMSSDSYINNTGKQFCCILFHYLAKINNRSTQLVSESRVTR